MDHTRWAKVDEYVDGALVPTDEALAAALGDSRAAGLPNIQVTPGQGMLLQLLARATGARRILEVGTLGGYSTIWLARALPEGGELTTLEFEAKHAAVARGNIERAGLAKVVEVIEGPAAATMPTLTGPYDLIFIDADKPGYPAYLPLALALSRPGTVIIADNVVRDGAVADPDSADANVRGVREFIELVAAEPRLTATVTQTVSAKGYDGFLLAVVA